MLFARAASAALLLGVTGIEGALGHSSESDRWSGVWRVGSDWARNRVDALPLHIEVLG